MTTTGIDDRERRGVAWRGFAAVFLPAFVVIASWSFAMPRDTGPDEPSHVVHAAGVVRGEFIGAPIPHFTGWRTVTVPAPYAYTLGVDQDSCYQSSALTPASCEPPWPSERGTTLGLTYTGQYPPAYYAVVGLPTLVTASVQGFYAMRLASALLAAFFLGLAGLVVARWSRNRLLSLGILVAATPMALYASAVVNPSALEISAALCLWVSGLVLVREHLESPPSGLVVIVAISAAALAAARAVSPLWLLVIALALLAAADTGVVRVTRDVLERVRVVQICVAGVVAVVGASLLWTLFAHALDVQQGLVKLGRHATAIDVLRTSIGREGVWAEELVGMFGSHEVRAPLPTYVAWLVAGALMTLAAVTRAKRRETSTLLGLVVVCVVVPIAMQFLHARDLGIVWQGRYTLPVAIGLPLVAAAVLGATSARVDRSWLVRGAFLVLPAASFLAFAEALRRYAVGVNGPIVYDHPAWQPPGGVVCWLCVNAVATAVLGAMLWRMHGPAPASTGDVGLSRPVDRPVPDPDPAPRTGA